MLDLEFDEDFMAQVGQGVQKINMELARKLSIAYNKALQTEKNKYFSALNRTTKNVYQGRKRGQWTQFYKRVASGLFAERITPKYAQNMTNEKLFDIKSGFNQVIGSGGENLPELYYFGKKTGRPLAKQMYVKPTKGNPVQHSLLRGQAKGAYSGKFLQSKDGGGKYVLPEGYISKAWRDDGKNRFTKYSLAIMKAFHKAETKVFQEMNR